jgi:hypothetical protein
LGSSHNLINRVGRPFDHQGIVNRSHSLSAGTFGQNAGRMTIARKSLELQSA